MFYYYTMGEDLSGNPTEEHISTSKTARYTFIIEKTGLSGWVDMKFVHFSCTGFDIEGLGLDISGQTIIWEEGDSSGISYNFSNGNFFKRQNNETTHDIVKARKSGDEYVIYHPLGAKGSTIRLKASEVIVPIV